jgi:hypothetical protein
MINGLKETRLSLWSALVLLLGVGAVLLYVTVDRSARIPGIVLYQDVGRGHSNETTFAAAERPPAGGTHHDSWLNCGVYTEPVETGQAVHSLEHGAVWITYRPDLGAEEITVLQERVRDEEYLILSPFPGQESPIVLTAWAVQLAVDSIADERIDDFIRQYRLGPTTPELGASCAKGEGEPLR